MDIYKSFLQLQQKRGRSQQLNVSIAKGRKEEGLAGVELATPCLYLFDKKSHLFIF